MLFQNFTLANRSQVPVAMMTSSISYWIASAKFFLAQIDDVVQTVAVPYVVRKDLIKTYYKLTFAKEQRLET